MAKSTVAQIETKLEEISTQLNDLENLKDEMTDSMENTPENFQQGDAWDKKEALRDALEALIDAYNDATAV